jgi:hypothetical protein
MTSIPLEVVARRPTSSGERARRGFKSRRRGKDPTVTDQQDRERESEESSETKFEERVEEERAERDRAAEQVHQEPELEERDD